MIEIPNRRTSFGNMHVDLWKGLFRDEVRIWKDVRPALGGLIGRETCWRGGGEALHALTVEKIQEGLMQQNA